MLTIHGTWTLAPILRLPEVGLRMVLTESGEARFRGEVTERLLEVAGCTDVEIALGIDEGVMSDEHRHQFPWIKDHALENYPCTVHRVGGRAFIDFVRAADGIVQVIAIGTLPSLAETLRRVPKIFDEVPVVGAGAQRPGLV